MDVALPAHGFCVAEPTSDELVLDPPAGRERVFAIWSSRLLPVTVRELRSLVEGGEGSRGSRSSRDIVRVRRAVEALRSPDSGP